VSLARSLITTGVAVVAGEITTSAHVDYDELVRNTIRGVGYDRAKYGYRRGYLRRHVHRQAPIAGHRHGRGYRRSGDQGLMFGFACDETDELMAHAHPARHRLTQRLSEIRKANKLISSGLMGSRQVTIEYRNGRPERVSCS